MKSGPALIGRCRGRFYRFHASLLAHYRVASPIGRPSHLNGFDFCPGSGALHETARMHAHATLGPDDNDLARRFGCASSAHHASVVTRRSRGTLSKLLASDFFSPPNWLSTCDRLESRGMPVCACCSERAREHSAGVHARLNADSFLIRAPGPRFWARSSGDGKSRSDRVVWSQFIDSLINDSLRPLTRGRAYVPSQDS